jgi:hypothetical protein
MALIEQQDVIHLIVQSYPEVPEKVKAYLEAYPSVRIVSQQVMPPTAFGIHLFLVVETV